jgi:hypothetical protein
MEGLSNNKENKEMQFKSRLTQILDYQITVENIDSYIDSSIEDLIALTDEIVREYKNDHPEEKFIGKELEDKAFEQNKLPNIEEFLDVAQAKLEQLNLIDNYIKNYTKTVSEIIIPPKGEKIMSGEKKYEDPDVKHRLKFLLYILKENGINFEDISMVDGILDEKIMRGKSYVGVVIPGLDRLALICDEEGNASYIFDTKKLEEKGIPVAEVYNMSKDELNKLIESNLKIGVRFVYTKNWASRAENFLFNELPEVFKEIKQVNPDIEKLPKVSSIELDPWKYFWTDPKTGKHWGVIRSLARRSGLSKPIIEKAAEGGDLTTSIIVKNIVGREGIAYCWEDFTDLPYIKERIEANITEQKGEWKGLYIDKNGNHWGNIDILSRRFDVGRMVIERFIKENNFSTHEVRTSSGISPAYCYEDFINNENIKSFLDMPKVEREGDWKGFHMDKNGDYWGLLSSIFKKLEVHPRVIYKILRENKISTIKVRTITNQLEDAYKFKEIMDIIENK